MKKSLALLGAALLGVGAVQAHVGDLSQMRVEGLQNGAAAELQQMSSRMINPLALVESGKAKVVREYSDSQYKYLAIMENTGNTLLDYWRISNEDGSSVSFEELPFYVVRYYLLRGPRNEQGYNLQCMSWCTYPSYDIFYDDGNYNLFDFEELVNSKDLCSTWMIARGQSAGDLLYYVNSERTEIVGFSIWSNLAGDEGTNIVVTSAGQQTVKFAEPTGTSQTFFTLNAYDPEDEDYLESANEFFLANNMFVECDYAGSATVEGFVIHDYTLELPKIHVFNGGEIGPDVAGYEDIYWYPLGMPEVETWNPVNQFYLAACSDVLDVFVTDDGGYATEDPTPFATANIGVGLIVEDAEDSELNYVAGALFSKVGTEEPYGEWNQLKPGEYSFKIGSQQINVLTMSPEAGGMVPYGYNRDDFPWSYSDGLRVCFHGSYKYMNEAKIALGTNEGLGMITYDQVGNSYSSTSKSNIVFHYDPANMQLTREISSVGDLEWVSGVGSVTAEGDFIKAVNGVISVNPAKDTTVAIYTIAGNCVANKAVKANETVNFNVEKGLYIVKSGKKAVKVIL